MPLSGAYHQNQGHFVFHTFGNNIMESKGDIDGSQAVADKLDQGKGKGEPTSEEGEERTSEQGEGPTSQEVGEPMIQEVEEPTIQEVEEPTSQEVGEPTSQDIEGQNGETVSLLQRVKNLRWIKDKDNENHNEAFEDCKYLTKTLGGKLDRKEKRVEELTNQVYNLVGFFSVFQGVILTAVSQLSQSTQSPQPTPVNCPSRTPLCKKVWFPIALSLLAAFAAVIGIGLKFWHIYGIDFTVRTYRHDLGVAEGRGEALVREGKKLANLESLEAIGYKRGLGKEQWLLKAVAVILLVITFTVLLILSYLTILCDKFV